MIKYWNKFTIVGYVAHNEKEKNEMLEIANVVLCGQRIKELPKHSVKYD